MGEKTRIGREDTMAGFITRQPNGLICRYSTVCDCITDYNMTEEQYINWCEKERGISREDSVDTINNYMREFSEVLERYRPNNMSVEQFAKIWKEMKQPKERCKHTQTVCDVKNVDAELEKWKEKKRFLK